MAIVNLDTAKHFMNKATEARKDRDELRRVLKDIIWAYGSTRDNSVEELANVMRTAISVARIQRIFPAEYDMIFDDAGNGSIVSDL